ncbi:hypothetical protein DFJ73DRAFT_784444 [Zopfochytrium polystomum]|nr:hypothetical protein DFJ73DRAFT_784444 [Zopfochytrium polystomum]
MIAYQWKISRASWYAALAAAATILYPFSLASASSPAFVILAEDEHAPARTSPPVLDIHPVFLGCPAAEDVAFVRRFYEALVDVGFDGLGADLSGSSRSRIMIAAKPNGEDDEFCAGQLGELSDEDVRERIRTYVQDTEIEVSDWHYFPVHVASRVTRSGHTTCDDICQYHDALDLGIDHQHIGPASYSVLPVPSAVSRNLGCLACPGHSPASQTTVAASRALAEIMNGLRGPPGNEPPAPPEAAAEAMVRIIGKGGEEFWVSSISMPVDDRVQARRLRRRAAPSSSKKASSSRSSNSSSKVSTSVTISKQQAASALPTPSSKTTSTLTQQQAISTLASPSTAKLSSSYSASAAPSTPSAPSSSAAQSTSTFPSTSLLATIPATIYVPKGSPSVAANASSTYSPFAPSSAPLSVPPSEVSTSAISAPASQQASPNVTATYIPVATPSSVPPVSSTKLTTQAPVPATTTKTTSSSKPAPPTPSVDPKLTPPGAVVQYYGGPILARVQISPVYWGPGGADTQMGRFQPVLDTYFDQLAKSNFFNFLEYKSSTQSLGRPSFIGSYLINEDNKQFVDDKQHVQAKLINTFYVFFLRTQSLSFNGKSSCYDFCYYNNAMDISSLSTSSTPYLYYTVIPIHTLSCPACARISTVLDLALFSARALVDGIVSPQGPLGYPGWTQSAASGAPGIGPAAVCNKTVGVGTVASFEGRYFPVPKVWSNVQKACVVFGA